jgi:lipid A 3-O-deacylase
LTARWCRRLSQALGSWLVAARIAFGAPPPVVECRAADDVSGRVYRVVDRGPDLNPRWLLTLQAKQFGSRIVELPQLAADRGSAVVSQQYMRLWLPALISLIAFAVPAAAQSTPNPPASAQSSALDAETLLTKNSSEWMFTAGAARGAVIFHSEGGHRFAVQAISWGRVLTESHLPGLLRGRFAWAFEAMPVFRQYEPTRAFGFGLSPLVWRWNFQPRGRIAPYAELAGGGLWTTEPVPEDTATANFTAHAGGGARFFVRPHQALVLTYWFHHISNGNRLDRNPSINSHVVQVGFAYIRARP